MADFLTRVISSVFITSRGSLPTKVGCALKSFIPGRPPHIARRSDPSLSSCVSRVTARAACHPLFRSHPDIVSLETDAQKVIVWENRLGREALRSSIGGRPGYEAGSRIRVPAVGPP